MKNRFFPEVENRLRVAGWYPERRIADEQLEWMDEEKPLFLHAQHVIEEFDGIYVEAVGTWHHSPDYRRSFCIDPLVLMGDDSLNRFERIMKRRVYPLGGIDYSNESQGNPICTSGEYAMFMDEYGCVYAFHHFTGDMNLLLGPTFDQALNNLGRENGFRMWDFANDIPLEAPYIFTDWNPEH